MGLQAFGFGVMRVPGFNMQPVIESTEKRDLVAIPSYPALSVPFAVRRGQRAVFSMDWDGISRVSGRIVDSSLRVHSQLGPGLLESTYRACLAYELRRQNLAAEEEVGLPVVYDSHRLEIGYRIDILVENLVVVEIKSVAAIAPIHKAQLLSYLKLSRKPLGLLLNFNVVLMKQGIVRMRNE